MTNELLRLTDEESAKAIQELAKFGSKAIDAGAGFGRYLDRVFGRVPDNLVGYLFGDWLEERRIRRAEQLRADTEEVRRQRGTTERIDVSPSIAIPLIQAAIDEDRDVLRDLWAKLLASATDPARAHLVRRSMIDLLKQLDPLDALVLQQLTSGRIGGMIAPGSELAQVLSGLLQTTRDEAHLSLEHLHELDCLMHSPNDTPFPALTVKARLLLRAVGG
jgi:hypothetical protein